MAKVALAGKTLFEALQAAAATVSDKSDRLVFFSVDSRGRATASITLGNVSGDLLSVARAHAQAARQLTAADLCDDEDAALFNALGKKPRRPRGVK